MPAQQLSLKLGGDSDLDLLTVHGHEELSRPFEFVLEVDSPRDLADLKKLALTAEVTFTGVNDETRVFHGLVARCVRSLDEASAGTFRYQLTVVPWFTFLRYNQDCRIFQGKNVVDVFKQVVGDHGFADFDVSNVRDPPPVMDYCVQYRESDFDFLSRLFEEHGLFYFFRHAAGKHTLVLCDSNLAFDTPGEELFFSRATSTQTAVTAWSQTQRYVTGKTTLREYDPAAPTQPIEVESNSVVKVKDYEKYSLYDYTGRFTTPSDGADVALVRMVAEETYYTVVRGSGNVTQIAAGRRFKIGDSFAGPDDALPDRQFICTSIDHEVAADTGYSCNFEGIPDGHLFQAPHTTPRAVVRGPQTATVVGPSGEEIFTDELGRIKVQFHWDRLGKSDDDSSCFVRVAQPLAGKGFGFQFLPRIGQEVVVHFLEGDPDRPLVTGAVYNSQLEPPYPLPDNATQSGIRTRSSKEGATDNFNEIRFEDKKGEEEFTMQAEKDMARVVKNDDVVQIGNDQTITVHNKRTLIVEEGDESITIKKGAQVTEVSEGNLSTKVLKGNREEEVSQGNDTLKIGQGDRNVEISMGNDVLAIKMGNQSTKLDLGKCSTEAMQGIELTVGQSSIKIDQMGVKIAGMMISINGQVQTEVKGLMLSLSADAMANLKGAITNIG
jgi:type VI secretion system secreted protein VgrG